ncbi:MAG: hypothetical protein Q8K37_00040 [Alphaproteobacteria bacterium]|nr:hypothetical protein [Alphaproteobacteria bacterium]
MKKNIILFFLLILPFKYAQSANDIVEASDNSSIILNCFGEPRQNIIGPNNQDFFIFEVIGDGNCGFSALNITRNEVLTYINNNIEDQAIRSLLTPEAKELYMIQALHDDFKKILMNELNITNCLTIDQACAFMFDRYWVDPSLEISPSDKYLGCNEKTPYEDEESTGLINIVAKIKNININIWRFHDPNHIENGVYLMRSIFTNPESRVVDLLLDGFHFKRLIAYNYYDSHVHDILNLNEALQEEQNWFKLYNRREEIALIEQAELIERLSNGTLIID